VTLLVTPEEAERLALASREGTLRLAMRNYNDDKIVLTSGTDVQGVLRAFSSVPAPVVQVKHWSGIAAPAPRPFEIEIMRNGQTREAVGFTRGAAVKSKANAPSEAAAPPAAEHDKTTVGSSEPTVAPPAGFGPNGKTIDIQ
jgi:hypothetical protein